MPQGPCAAVSRRRARPRSRTARASSVLPAAAWAWPKAVYASEACGVARRPSASMTCIACSAHSRLRVGSPRSASTRDSVERLKARMIFGALALCEAAPRWARAASRSPATYDACPKVTLATAKKGESGSVSSSTARRALRIISIGPSKPNKPWIIATADSTERDPSGSGPWSPDVVERLEPVRQRRLVAGQGGHPGCDHVRRRVGGRRAGVDGLEPPPHGDGATGVDVGEPVALDEQTRGVEVAGGEGVLDGLVDVPVVAEPLGGSRVQGPHPLGMSDLELAASHGREEVVEAEPDSLVAQGNDEEIGAGQVVEQRRRGGRADDVVAEGGGEPVEDRDARDEVADLGSVPAQHLLGEVVADEAVAAAEGAHELVGVAAPGQGEGGEVEPGRPALGALHELVEGASRTAPRARTRGARRPPRS